MKNIIALSLIFISFNTFSARVDISPYGKVRIGGVAGAPEVAAAPKTGKEVYDTTCSACHATGAAGAPMLSSKEAWAPRLDTGLDSLVNSAINGKGAMPPKGGNTSLSDEEIKATVEYIISLVK